MLERAEENLVHDKFGQVRNLPANSGTKINFRRINSLAPSTVPLTEGVTPTGSQLTATDINATVSQYGDFVTLTDVLDMHGLDKNVSEAVDILSTAAGETADEVIRDGVVPSLGNKIYIAADEASTVAGDIVTVAAFKAAELQLKKQNAKRMAPMIDATDKVGTSAIKASYWGIVHPDVVFDLEGQTGYIPAENYASTKTLMEYEVGAVSGIRLVESNKAYINAGGGSVNVSTYHTAIFGDGCYGVVKPSKGNMEVIVKQLGSGQDELNQRSSVGYKFSLVSKILNDAFGVSIVSASSQGANA